jgi:hypothetical protein
VIAWGTLTVFILFGEARLADLASMVKSTTLLLWAAPWFRFGALLRQSFHRFF